MPPLRLGSVRFLNALPLLEGLSDSLETPIWLETPARIAAGLATGSLDLGLVPVVEAARQRLYAVPGLGVAALDCVRSVLLLSRGPLSEARTLALDPASRTSAALAQLIVRRESGQAPRLVAGPERGQPLAEHADAGLVIGDRALTVDSGAMRVTDLASWWHQDTGLPFVFAVWAGPDESLVRAATPHLERAKLRGAAALGQIAEREAAPRGIDPALARSYLSESIRYDLGALEHDGLELFLARLVASGDLPASSCLRFLQDA